jgi:hypothetical protein
MGLGCLDGYIKETQISVSTDLLSPTKHDYPFMSWSVRNKSSLGV